MILQSIPDGKPDLVQPSLAKLEVDKLKTDIPKYKEHDPHAAYTALNGWLGNIDELLVVPETYEWPLDVLSAAEKIQPSTLTDNITEDLQQLRDKETQETRTVHKYLCLPCIQ